MSLFQFNNHKATAYMESLALDSLDPGLHKLRMPMVSDGLGRSVQLPILVLKGTKKGHVLGITSAIHGNEINGIPVIHQLVRQIDPAKLRGSIVAVPVVNIPGFLARTRTYEDGKDLNRIMPGRSKGEGGEAFAYRFVEKVLRHFDFLVDLHTASFGRANSLYIRADLSHGQTHRMALLQRPQIILNNTASDGSLRGQAATMGIPAITIEIGNPNLFQPKLIKRTLVGLRAVLGELKMMPKSKIQIKEDPVICADSFWIYSDHGGILKVLAEPTEFVEKGQKIAMLRTIYGDLICEYRAPCDGIVIGKSINPVATTGARILHLGVFDSND